MKKSYAVLDIARFEEVGSLSTKTYETIARSRNPNLINRFAQARADFRPEVIKNGILKATNLKPENGPYKIAVYAGFIGKYADALKKLKHNNKRIFKPVVFTDISEFFAKKAKKPSVVAAAESMPFKELTLHTSFDPAIFMNSPASYLNILNSLAYTTHGNLRVFRNEEYYNYPERRELSLEKLLKKLYRAKIAKFSEGSFIFWRVYGNKDTKEMAKKDLKLINLFRNLKASKYSKEEFEKILRSNGLNSKDLSESLERISKIIKRAYKKMPVRRVIIGKNIEVK